MVKITGPLTSTAASGSVGGAITFATWKGRPYVRELVKPKNPNSGKQRSNRIMLAWLSQQWSGLSDWTQDQWTTAASQHGISPFNAFIGLNMERWRSFQGATTRPTVTDFGTQGDIQNVAAVGKLQNFLGGITREFISINFPSFQ